MPIDRSAVGAGALLGLAVAVPAIVVAQLVDAVVGLGRDSNVWFVFYLVFLAGLVAAGHRSARRRPDAPFAHGAGAALAAYLVLALATTVVRAVRGRPTDPVQLVFHGFMSASAGILGALLSTRRPRAHGRPAEEPGA